MRRSTRMGLAAAGVAVAAACSETVYTYRPALVEAQALDEAALRLAAACEAREGSIVEDDVDLAGRRALFDLALHVARTRTDAGGQLDEVLRLFAELAAPLPLPAVAEGDVAPLDDLAAHAREIAARRAAELAPVLPESADGGTGSAIGDLAAGIRTRAQETTRDQVRRLLEGSFPEEAAACHAVRKASLRGE